MVITKWAKDTGSGQTVDEWEVGTYSVKCTAFNLIPTPTLSGLWDLRALMLVLETITFVMSFGGQPEVENCSLQFTSKCKRNH